MSGLFKSKKSNTQSGPSFETLYDPFAGVRSKVAGWLESQVGQAGPTYTGERVAAPSDIESAGLDWAREYATSPVNTPNLSAAQKEINKTLSGEYDPSTSAYYQAIKAESQRNLEKQNEYIKSNASGGRRYFSGARLKAQSDAAADVNTSLNTTMGQLAENERQRMMQAVPLAVSVEDYIQNAPAKKSATLQTLGALPRELEQAYLDAIYQEWMQSNYEWPLNIAQLSSGLASQEPIFYQTGYSANRGNNLASIINDYGPIVMQALAMMG